MKRTVFISHSSKDKAIGDEVCRFLEANGISCWIAPRDVTPGKNYGAAIVDAIDECAVFVLVLTSESNKSGQVVREVERAANANAVIIPLRVEAVQPSRDLEFYVSSSHWLDAAEKPLAKHLGNLLTAIKNWKTDNDPAPAGIAPTISPPVRRSNSPLMFAGFVIGAVILGAIIFLAVKHSPNRETASPANASTGSVATPTASSATESEADETAATVLPNYIREVTASSMLHDTYKGKPRVHSPNHAFDGKQISVWVPATSGVGEWIMARFKSPMTITSVSIFGGSGFDRAHYQNHNRVHELRMTFDDGTTEMLTLEDKMQLQRLEIRHPGMVESVKFEIVSVFRGAKLDLTPIAEIAFNRD